MLQRRGDCDRQTFPCRRTRGTGASLTTCKSFLSQNGLIDSRSSLYGAHGFGYPLEPCPNLLSPLQFAQGLDRLDWLLWGGVQTAERASLGETLARKPLEPACRNTAVIDRSRAFCKNSANVIRRQYLSIAILLIDMRPAILSASTLAHLRYCTITLKLKNLVAVVRISGTQGSEYSTGISGGLKQGRPRWHIPWVCC